MNELSFYNDSIVNYLTGWVYILVYLLLSTQQIMFVCGTGTNL